MIVNFFIFAWLFSWLKADLIRPVNGSEIQYVHVVFEWEQIPEASSYEIEISTSSDFSGPMVQFVDNSLLFIEKEFIDWDQTYFWRVRPMFPSYNFGSWSDIYFFSTGVPISDASATTFDHSQVQGGLTIFGAFFNYFSAVIDQTGREVWNTGSEDIVYYNISKYGDLFGCYLNPGMEHNLPGIEFSFDKGTLWSEPNLEFMHHDLIQLPNGNYMGIVETNSMGPIPIGEWTPLFQSLGFVADGSTIEFPWVGDKLVEWDKDTKEIIWEWNVFDHFNMNDFDQFGGTWNQAYLDLHHDWTHVNALTYDDSEDAIYISTRHLSRITKIDYPSGEIIWNMGHNMPSGDVEIGHEIGFSFQHSVQILDNGNILTFDNGNLSPEFRQTEQQISRAIEIKIDSIDNVFSAELIWEYELAPELFGFASGNAQKLDNGNVLITTVGGGGRSIEVSGEGEIIWQGEYNLSLPNGAVYRATKIPGIHPTEYSVLINNYQEYNGKIGVYVSEGFPSISFKILNEGDYAQDIYYEMYDEKGWFENSNGNNILSPGQEIELNFFGQIPSDEISNQINLITTPKWQPEKSKTTSVTVYTEPLSKLINEIADDFQVGSPFPNPFNSVVNIPLKTKDNSEIKLDIYNTKGDLIGTQTYYINAKGHQKLSWDGSKLSTGLYFLKLENYNYVQTRKILFLK